MDAKLAGGKVDNIPEEDLLPLECAFRDPNYEVMNAWVSSLPEDADPYVTPVMIPLVKSIGSAPCPPLADLFLHSTGGELRCLLLRSIR